MKNFEKYEEEIKDLGYCIALDKKSNKLCSCKETECTNCKFCSGEYCSTSKIKWLYEECKESLLTNEEKEYLKAVIKPFKGHVYCLKFYNEKLYIYYYEGEKTATILPLHIENQDMVEVGHQYTLKELGLED